MRTILMMALMTATAYAGPFEDVCASRFVKSAKLESACKANEPPAMLKDGSRFKAQGIGAEINALAANLHLVAQN